MFSSNGNGATTLSITTLRMMSLFVALSITALYHNAECHVNFIIFDFLFIIISILFIIINLLLIIINFLITINLSLC
jgi:hypothetical protein